MARFAILALCLLSVAFGQPANSKVTSVPGFAGTFPFNLYSGYLPANDGQKQMFYLFAESQNSPANDPVVLWLNGGPGCSSFDGFIYEHGPFFFNDGPMGAGQNITLNPYSWNKVANMIYLDSPCGVGLSYSTNPNDYDTNDKITAHDSHNFLVNFFKAYPQFKSNDFYIAGESYAGIYVPTLAQQVYLGNSNQSQHINMKGYLVGNGVTDQVFDGNALVPFVYGHSLISTALYNDVVTACGGIDNVWNATSDSCMNALQNVTDNVGSLNVYDILVDCYLGDEDVVGDVMNLMDRVTLKNRISSASKKISKKTNLGENVPCIDASRATAWINQDSVRTALHAIPVSQQTWSICSDLITYTSIYTSVIPIHQQLVNAGFRVLVYSGDSDMCVPNTGSEAWTSSLNLAITDEWRPWFVNQQVAGYVQSYQGLTYATIKGAGHTVPQYKPPQALYFFTQFMSEQPF